MATKSFVIQNFYGGIAQNQKAGQPHSFRFGRNLELFEDTNYVTLKPKPSKVSGSTVTNLIKWAADGSPWDTNRYFYGGATIYKETSGGVWSSYISVGGTGANAQGMAVYNNYLYYATAENLYQYGPLNGTPAERGMVTYYDYPEQTIGSTGNTYSVTTSINEGATHRQTFTMTNDPLYGIAVVAASKGTGNWTLTVHTANNDLVGSATLTNAELANGVNTFFFPTSLRVVRGNTYHYHITSTVADGTVDTGTSSDLEAAISLIYNIDLIYTSDYHPMMEFLNMLVIGNANYLATWDDAVYTMNRIQFAPGFKVRALAKIDEYIVAACWKGTSIDEFEEGRLYFWDGVSTTFNFFKQIEIGSPNAIANSKNRIFGVYGSSGGMYVGVEPFQQVHSVPQLGRGKKVEVYPGAITDWQGDTLIGVAGSTDDGTTLEQGVYEWGNGYDSVPEGLNYAYQVSTGTRKSTGLKIGMVKAFGKDLYISWDDNSTYGVDKVIKTNNPATSGSYESLVFDDGAPQKTKNAKKIVVTFEPLESGETVTPKYKIDRATSWTTGTTISTVGATRAELVITNGRFRELEIGFDLVTSTTFLVITGVYLQYDDLRGEVEES